MLQDNAGNFILNLHVWGEHEHPTLTKSATNNGNGLILYLKVQDLEKCWEKAKLQGTTIEFEPQLNESSGQKEFALRDLDGYYLLVSQ
ncbi:MAG: glyoxalase [Crocinitomix sp.]|nr:glyoxalase [Crocinitomix sp.]